MEKRRGPKLPDRLRPKVRPRKRPRRSTRVIVCGPRDWTDEFPLKLLMAGLEQMERDPWEQAVHAVTVIHGAAKGADTLAAEWASIHWIPTVPVLADWATHGKGAGPIRNRKMLHEHKPHFVFGMASMTPEQIVPLLSRGTGDMINRAAHDSRPTYVIVRVEVGS